MLSLLSLTLLINEAVAAPVDFDTQVMPILTKAGCNTGACHGAAAGRGGFHLSLYGSRPERDFNEIVVALEGRRINRRNSENSLLLQKPTEQLNHEGGTRIDMDSADFGMLKQWIDDGANRLRRRKLERFQVAADVDVVTDLNRSVQLTALAIFSDGTEQNVSPWTVFSPEDPASVSIDESGLTEIRRRGRHVIVARYLDRVQAIELIAPMSDATAMHDVVEVSYLDGIKRHILKLAMVGPSTARN